ncbi:derepression protein [Escherichia coli]|uniref:derepression protein n=1 Tax=Escherichia coli TaxID=562 RepID=UPI00201A3433|nr:derepression protein [Escherichia coli]MCN3785925.1 derepression protein [Escherichia coli]
MRSEINRRLFRATRVAQIMHINMLHERTHALSNRYCAAVFSYLAEDLAELQSLINQHR